MFFHLFNYNFIYILFVMNRKDIEKFVKWHREDEGSTNLAALANVGIMPVSSGKKSTTATKRRKGSAKKQRNRVKLKPLPVDS